MRAEPRDHAPISGIAARSPWAGLSVSVGWHLLLVGMALAVAGWLPSHPPLLVVQEVHFIREEAPPQPGPPRVEQPNPPAAAPLPSVPVPVSRSLPTRPRSSPAAAVTPSPTATESAVDSAAKTSDSAAPTTSPAAPVVVAVEAPSAPAYHMGAVSTPSPDYPYSARKRRREGLVLIGLEVAADGSVSAARILEGSGDASLDEAALSTLGRWKLRPATLAGQPVAGRVEVPVRFRLE